MMKLRSPGRAVLVTENTWETHRRWLVDSKRFAMELEVAPGVMKAPGWHFGLSYEQKGRVRNDQEHKMFHWVQLLMQPGHQRAISAPASSSGSSSSAKRSAAALSTSQPAEVKALTSKLDKLAATVKLLADKSSSVSKRKASQGKAGKGKAKGSAPKSKGRGTRFEDLVRQHKDKFVLKREEQEVCFKFQDGNCTDQGCVRAHV